MFRTLKTLFDGANARAEERVRTVYSIELIEQKIREATRGLQSAKMTLAGLKQRERSEARQVTELDERIADLESRAREALAAGREALAGEAAEAIARLENERTIRQRTVERLEARTVRLQASVETANRRLIDLRQGAIAAKAARLDGAAHNGLSPTLSGQGAMREAEELVRSVLAEDDPFEQAEILAEIDAGLDRSDVAERLGEAGFGAATKSTKADVLKRLKNDK